MRSILQFFFCSLLFISFSLNPTQAQFQQNLPDNLAKEIEEQLSQANELEEKGDFNQAAFFINRAATTYWVNGFPFKAVELFERTIQLNQKIGNLNAIRTLHNNIGLIYTDEEDFPKALSSFRKSLDIARQMNRKPDIASSLINIANVQSESGDYNAAQKSLDEATALAKELNDERMLRNCFSLLADVYEKLGDSEKSSHYFSLYTAISRKIQQDEIRKRDSEARQMVDEAKTQVSEIERAKQETEKELLDKQLALQETEESLLQVEQISKERQMQIDLLNTERELQDAIIRNQRMVRNVFVVIIIAVLIFAGMIFYSLREKKKANEKLSKQNKEIAAQKDLIEEVNKDLESAFNKIEKQNRDITSSINYAQRIQQAMLPEHEKITAVIPESFVLLRPRDIVSGDFYWYTGYGTPKALKGKKHKHYIKLHNLCEDDSGFLLSAVDCTGHGVPGAFMSMIGFNLLETIIRNGVVLPNEILNELHQSIRYLLKQYNTDNHDGMDMTICSVKDNGRKVLFAGAKNPLIYIANGELNYLKGDAVPIGGMQKEDKREFTLHAIDVDVPTEFYIYSDGYTDQFGGLHGKKFGTKHFKELLMQIHKLPMVEQKQILDDKMNQWIGDRKQIDDIIVLGFRVGDGEIEV